MHRLYSPTDEELAPAEKLLIDAVIHALHVVCNQMADQIGHITVAAASEPTPEQAAQAAVDAAPAGPPGQPYVSVDDLASMPSLWAAQAQQLILPLTAEIYRDSADKLHAQMVDLIGPSVPSISSQAAEDYLAAATNRWDVVGDEVWNTARAQLVEGFQQGESIPKLAARVRSTAGLSQRSATAIARTEVVAASNAGSYATALSSQLDMVKVWLATDDERTRRTHNVADGQRRPLNQPFEVGVSTLDFPGAPGGAPEEIYNCRCSVTYEITDEEVRVGRARAGGTTIQEPTPVGPAPGVGNVPPSIPPGDLASLPRISGTESTSTAAKAINPHFGATAKEGMPTYRDAARARQRWTPEMGPLPSGAYEENCSNVVLAFEMRRRGYAIQAAPLDVLDRYGYAAGRTVAEMDQLLTDAWRLPGGRTHGRSLAGQAWRSFVDIDKEILRDWPEGGRGFISVGKHVFNVVKERGKVVYIEAQYDINATRVATAEYKKKYSGGGEDAKLIRLDDLVPADGILQAVVVGG